MIYPKVSCEKCYQDMEEDEAFEPNCKVCEKRYGVIPKLMIENYSSFELYQVLNSEVVNKFKLQTVIWGQFKERIEDEGTGKVLNKLFTIAQTVKEYTPEERKK
tara:strand:- start:8652 stop:8963 length:312 start_codon:yes stop_codon:yes gene_type:complete